ncbi:MAG: hypothetical protein HKL88_10415 [Bacteroidia bacterium]|nr:hypothetical protein [Bacteroidia bacterium]
MKKNILWILAAYTLLGLAFSSCSGPAGPVGAQGPPGTKGTSNIQFVTYTVPAIAAPAGDWNPIGSPNPTGYGADLIVPAITTDTNLVVQVYYSLSGISGPWSAMPSTQVFYAPGTDTADQLGFNWDTKNVTIVYNIMPPIVTQMPKNTIYFDVAVIPPVYMRRHPNVNWKSGTAVMQLPEVEAELHITPNK